MNHDGPPLVKWAETMPQALPATEVADRAQEGAWLVDLRDPTTFGAGHPADAINIPVRGRFESWTGTMIPWGEPFVLVGSDQEVEEAAFRLKRVGYDAPLGYLQGGLAAWTQAELPVAVLELVKPETLHEQMQAGTAPIIVDVRLPTEWMGLRIGDVLNIPLNQLFVEGKRLSKDMPVLTVCNSAYRSSMGASVLQKLGFKTVLNMEGGSEAWIAGGLPTLGADPSAHAAFASAAAVAPAARAAPTAPAARAASPVRLPERLAAAELGRMLMDVPGTFEIVDVRPLAQFADYSLPGSIHVDIAEVVASPAYQDGVAPLVIVDRDGSLAMAVGGILAQRTQRSIKVLYGGLEAYWNDSALPMPSVAPGARVVDAKEPVAGAQAPGGPAAPAPAPAAPAPAAPAAPKKKSAGC